ncbi:glucan endo-1,3-beta-glucosidase 1 [Tanacetum coccineum]
MNQLSNSTLHGLTWTEEPLISLLKCSLLEPLKSNASIPLFIESLLRKLVGLLKETGWPSKGDSKEPYATVDNADTYNSNLIKYIFDRSGIPFHPEYTSSVYIYELFNEDLSGELLAYDTTNQTYCVATDGIDGKTLQTTLDWAWGPGRANCSEIQPGENCYQPNNVKNHVSYAFDSYYEKQGRSAGSCDFKGVAMITTTDPKGLNNILESWREALEENELRVSREKAEYLRYDFGSIPINRGLIQAIPTLLPRQPIREATKASNLQRIPPGVQGRSQFTYFLYLIVQIRILLALGTTSDLPFYTTYDRVLFPLVRGTMAGVDVDTLTMKQYLALSRENQAQGVVKPKIRGNVNFKIKSQFMRELRKDTFSGNKDEDAHNHIEFFPLLLPDPQKGWWTDSPQELSIPGISSKRPLSKGIAHLPLPQSSLKIFPTSSKMEMNHYTRPGNGLSTMNRQLLDSQGPILEMRLAEALTAIQTMADHSQKWHDETTSRNIGSSSSKDGLAALINKLDAKFAKDLTSTRIVPSTRRLNKLKRSDMENWDKQRLLTGIMEDGKSWPKQSRNTSRKPL